MILIMGMPGAGKSVQSQLLQQKLGLHWTSTGRLLRALDNPQFNQILDRGDLIDDHIVIELLAKTLKNEGYDKNFLLDGFPRNPNQAQWLLDHAAELGKTVKGILFLDLDDDTAVQRMLARGRNDDTEEVLKNRRAEFKKVEPTIEFLKDKGVPFHRVDAAASVEEVYRMVVEAISEINSYE